MASILEPLQVISELRQCGGGAVGGAALAPVPPGRRQHHEAAHQAGKKTNFAQKQCIENESEMFTQCKSSTTINMYNSIADLQGARGHLGVLGRHGKLPRRERFVGESVHLL